MRTPQTWWLLLAACNDYELAPKDDAAGALDTAAPEASCEDWSPGPGQPPAQVDCTRAPTVGSFDPVIEWQWSSNPLQPGYDDIMATPAVANLTDDDGDGDVDADDIPDVVFASFAGGAYTSAGAISAISGDGSGTHFSILSVGGHGFYSSSGVALGDLEGDGVIEVCASGTSASVVCFSVVAGVPTLRFAAGAELGGYGCPAIADLDGDGVAEVLMGRQIFDAAGNLVGLGAYGIARMNASFAVDMDADGQLEVVVGNAVYNRDGSALWADGGFDGLPAVGDFDGDGLPEVVRSGSGVVRLNDTDGAVLWETALPGGGSGGAPTVADLDGDGQPEVGVAGQAYYTVFDTDGAVMWSNPTSDYSSSVTGSSVFDFEGDGRAEIVYADELNLWIYDGLTGEVLLQQEGHASGTLYEYPLIADVDNDGSTEILLASNNYTYAGWNGITVFGDASGSWAGARPVWNQFAYHITNINADGSIPVAQTANWLSWNNFRAGGTELGPSHWLPQLSVHGAEACEHECEAGRVEVWVEVHNAGLADAVGVEVVLYRGEGGERSLLRSGTVDVTAGGSTWAGPWTLSQAEWGATLWAEVDPGGAVEECVEGDGLAELGSWPCRGG